MKIANSVTEKVECGCGKVYVIAEFNSNGDISRLQLESGKRGTCIKNMLDAVGRTSTLAIKNGASVKDIISIFNNESCHRMRSHLGKTTYSCLDAVSKALKSILKEVGNSAHNEDK